MKVLNQYGATQERLNQISRCPGQSLARVISQYKGGYKLATETGECLAEVSGKFRYEASRLSDYPAVGDFVAIDSARGEEDPAVIHRVLPRASVFERRAVGDQGETQVVAANVNVVFLCMSLNHNYSLNRIERYLAAAWASRAQPVILLTKADLCPDLQAVLSEMAVIAPGVEVVATSADDPSSWERLRRWLEPGSTASFIGSSGVGKSTLINRLAGRELLATSAIGQYDKGRHTTTRRELFLLPNGGAVIDTPGMRELGVETAELSKTFADLDELASCCRFRDCTHTNEPGCAVRRALEEGVIDQRRLESRRKLEREAKYDGLTSRQREHEKLEELFEGVGGMKKARKHLRQIDKRNRGR